MLIRGNTDLEMNPQNKAIYLDYNSTTPLAPEVITSISQSLQEDWANPSSDSVLGRKAHDTIEAARVKVARMIHAQCVHDVIFTSGGTESNNMAIWSVVEWSKQHFQVPHVIVSNVEHIATLAFVKYLAVKGLIDYSEVAVNRDGCLEVTDVLAAIRPSTVLISIMMANNETGVIFPIHQIGRELEKVNKKRKHRVWFHVDAAQAIGKVCVNTQDLGVDYLTIVGHKFYGPRIGALYVRKMSGGRVVSPLVRGGGQENGFRPGTENTPMIAGLGTAAQLVTDRLNTYAAHMKEVRDYLLKQLKKNIDRTVVNCEKSERLPNTLSVSWSGCPLSGLDILAKCPHLVASTTAACHDQSQLSDVLLKSGVPEYLAKSTIRLSVGRDTTFEDIDSVVKDLIQGLQQG